MERLTIVMLGSGNVATHLSTSLDKVHNVVQVYSPTLSHAKELAEKLSDCIPTNQPKEINKNADLYIIAVRDDKISETARMIDDVAGIVAHTSGSVGIEAIHSAHHSSGVFYPLQTFSKGKDVEIEKVPFFIEASDSQALDTLKQTASQISQKVYEAGSEQRGTLHLAAVVGSNFFNHLLDISSRILEKDGYTLEVLKPLLKATLDKAMDIGPYQAQTGPAVRGDEHIIKTHLDKLEGLDRDVYDVMSRSITERHKK